MGMLQNRLANSAADRVQSVFTCTPWKLEFRILWSCMNSWFYPSIKCWFGVVSLDWRAVCSRENWVRHAVWRSVEKPRNVSIPCSQHSLSYLFTLKCIFLGGRIYKLGDENSRKYSVFLSELELIFVRFRNLLPLVCPSWTHSHRRIPVIKHYCWERVFGGILLPLPQRLFRWSLCRCLHHLNAWIGW